MRTRRENRAAPSMVALQQRRLGGKSLAGREEEGWPESRLYRRRFPRRTQVYRYLYDGTLGPIQSDVTTRTCFTSPLEKENRGGFWSSRTRASTRFIVPQIPPTLPLKREAPNTTSASIALSLRLFRSADRSAYFHFSATRTLRNASAFRLSGHNAIMRGHQRRHATSPAS